MPKWKIFLFVYFLSWIPALSCLFDYSEWDEAGYTLASDANFHHQSYLVFPILTLSNSPDKDLNPPFLALSRQPAEHSFTLTTYVYPYPNILYSMTFGAFNRAFSLTPSHESRLIFLTFLLAILILSMTSLTFVILSGSVVSQGILSGVALLTNSLLLATLFQIKGAQIGATIFLIFSLVYLYKSHQYPSRRLLLGLAAIFLFLSFFWKEQILPFLVIFIWLFPSVPKKERIYRYVFYTFFLIVVGMIFYGIVHLLSVNAGFAETHYYYSSETKAWGTQFDFQVWIGKIFQIPLLYFLLFLSIFFILRKDYQRFDLLENKMFFLGVAYFFVSTIFYFYQTIDYIASINYPSLLFLSMYFLCRLPDMLQRISPSVIRVVLIFLCIPILGLFYNNHHATRAVPLLEAWHARPMVHIPPLDPKSLVAMNHPVLAGIYAWEQIKNKPSIGYAKMAEEEFLEALHVYRPELILFRTDRGEYRVSDDFMRKYRMRRSIDAKGVKYVFGGDITQGAYFFQRQGLGKKS